MATKKVGKIKLFQGKENLENLNKAIFINADADYKKLAENRPAPKLDTSVGNVLGLLRPIVKVSVQTIWTDKLGNSIEVRHQDGDNAKLYFQVAKVADQSKIQNWTAEIEDLENGIDESDPLSVRATQARINKLQKQIGREMNPTYTHPYYIKIYNGDNFQTIREIITDRYNNSIHSIMYRL